MQVELQPSHQVRITYIPSVPSLTIRTIISTIKSIHPSLQVCVVQEQTVDDRAEALARREQKALLHRLLVAFAFSIPAFIIGIVFVSLLPPSALRSYFTEPLWINVPRSTWVLFFLATPVWLFVDDIFHRKAITEILNLWRRGTPLSQRFLKFGSMNLLV
jgi:Cu+-exporting ATPase